MADRRIQRISAEQMQQIVILRKPTGLFLAKERSYWVAVDNTTGEAWTEDFTWKYQAVSWLLRR